MKEGLTRTSAYNRSHGGARTKALVAILGLSTLIGVLNKTSHAPVRGVRFNEDGVRLRELQNALALYFADCKRFPAERLEALTVPDDSCPGWGPDPYLRKMVTRDIWKRPYLYRTSPDLRHYVIETLGKDGTPGGCDDDSDLRIEDTSTGTPSLERCSTR